jgi:putative ABC transport system permease protein
MNRFALLALYRSLSRHKLYAALNIGGLAVGIAVFLVLGLYVRFQTSFETWLPHHDEIHVVETIWHNPGSPFDGPSSYTMGGLLEEMRQDFPGVIGTRVQGGEGGGQVIRGSIATVEDVAQVDGNFFDVFDLAMVSGSGKALVSPTNALVSRSFAHRFFGDTNPVGQTLTVGTGNDVPADFRIAGVFEDLPKNSDFRLSVLIPLPANNPADFWHHWGSTSLNTYLRFATPEAAQAFAARLSAFVDRRALHDIGPHASQQLGLALLPLTAQHFTPEGTQSAGTKITVVTLGIVGVLTLLIAIVNYVNLATARAGLRAREVAMRKVLGADRVGLIRQFLGEAVLMVALSALLGLILAELGLPLVNAAGGLSLSIPYALVVPGLALLAVMVGVAAGAWPALLLSHFPAAAVLASARAPGGGRSGNRLREALVMLQFGLATAFIIGTMVLVAQVRHVRHTDLGFQRQGLILVRGLSDVQIDAARVRRIVDAFRRLPGVQTVGIGNSGAGGGSENDTDNVPIPGRPGEGPSLRRINIGPDFFAAYAPRLLAGRLFDEAHGTDDATDWFKRGLTRNVVINRKALAALGFHSPQEAIGKVLGGKHPIIVIGVIDQLRFFSPRQPDDPTFYVFYREMESNLVASIRFNGDPRATLAGVEGAWRQLAPTVPFQGDPAERRLARFYEEDDRATRLFGIGAGLAVLIGCVGLWGLASFNTARRVKEIGIRKTLGASTGDIVKLLVGQFLRPVLVANLIAWPLAWLGMRMWLAGFDDRIALSPLYFLAASLLAVVIAVVTVIGQALRASRAAPGWALRHE